MCISRDAACARAPSIWFMGVFGTDDRLENWRVRLTMQLASLQSQRPSLSDITWPKHSTVLKHLLSQHASAVNIAAHGAISFYMVAGPKVA